jgi:hypothetical protein
MYELEQAIAITETLRTLIEDEVERARQRRVLVRSLDSVGLLDSVRHREEFNRQVARAEVELSELTTRALRQRGLAQGRLSDLVRSEPVHGETLARRLGELRDLVRTLREIDAATQNVTRHALGWIRSCVGTLAPAPVAYDRRGAANDGGAISTSCRVA